MTQTLYHNLPAGSVAEHDRPDLICFAPARWDFVYQRPHHLMSRAARDFRVFFVEEPRLQADRVGPRLEVIRQPNGVRVVIPWLPQDQLAAPDAALRGLLANLFAKYRIEHYVLWYQTPAALAFTSHLNPLVVIYDAADGAAEVRRGTQSSQDAEILRRADVVLTGSSSLYDVARDRHDNVHLVPSAIDAAHFAQARIWQPQPADQAAIPQPRLGFFGVLDERLDFALIDQVAAVRPGWQLIFIGPVLQLSLTDLPQRSNIHYLGLKSYLELPAYLAGWDVAMLPFAVNDATRYSSPTKIPEYLAGGKPVITTPIPDVVNQYGATGLVQIAATPAEFVAAGMRALFMPPASDRSSLDQYLTQTSWDEAWRTIARLIEVELITRHAPALARARIAQAHTGELLLDEIALSE
jgi:glycosyltransferase involved in cell wall biosynthesis